MAYKKQKAAHFRRPLACVAAIVTAVIGGFVLKLVTEAQRLNKGNSERRRQACVHSSALAPARA